MKQRLTLYQDVHNALQKVPTNGELGAILSGAAQSAYLKSTPAERAIIDAQTAKLRSINQVGEYTALEILAAIGRLMDR